MKYLLLVFLFSFQLLPAQETQRVYLSGTGAQNTVEWDFMCSSGNNSGSWQKINVPSSWEQEGFGTYNYGRDKFDERGKETGFYKYSFSANENWKNKVVQIVFEGVMTDCEVKVNGKLAGLIHQGAFYQFKYDITGLIKFGQENLLEVKVKKHSDNNSVNEAERNADYWIFGGIFRPVYLDIKPKEHIDRLEIDAKANGAFTSRILLANVKKASTVSVAIENDKKQEVAKFSVPVKKNMEVAIIKGQVSDIKTWSPEFPNMYLAKFELKGKDGNVIHTDSEKIGFRTVEVREQDGIYVNDVRVKFKGVNRHTFHPDYARTSNKAFSINDVNLIKNMNMNAVRMAHYPPEKHFLEVSDSLGLFVLNELAGWQDPPYDSIIGRKLLKEMIERDMNHPSIVLWDNGNEGGWNSAYDEDFRKLDIQEREVLHPWAVHEKTNTAHYINYNYLSTDNFSQRKIFFPTEFLHGLYDGGHGAGLEDYWKLMYSNPLCAGGFLWSYADECILRSDTHTLDCSGNNAPDGIVGPYFEKEGSYYAIKEIWSPVFMEKRHITHQFNGVFNIENRFHYTNLKDCSFTYKWNKAPEPVGLPESEEISVGTLQMESILPGQKGYLKVPLHDNWQDADVLTIEAIDPHGRLIKTWSWPVNSPESVTMKHTAGEEVGQIEFKETKGGFLFKIKDLSIEIGKEKGILVRVSNAQGNIPLKGGPFINSESIKCKGVNVSKNGESYIVKAVFEEDQMGINWTIHPNGLIDLDVYYQLPEEIKDFAGISFNYPEDKIKGVRFMGNGPYRVWKNRMAGPTFGVWDKAYNNTITGHSGYEYPEFKGYYSNFYWARFSNKSEPGFTVYSKSEDVFLRLFTPENAPEPGKTVSVFPPGDISFMHGISPIGSKFKNANEMGPQSQPYQFVPKRVENGVLAVSLTFNFLN